MVLARLLDLVSGDHGAALALGHRFDPLVGGVAVGAHSLRWCVVLDGSSDRMVESHMDVNASTSGKGST